MQSVLILVAPNSAKEQRGKKVLLFALQLLFLLESYTCSKCLPQDQDQDCTALHSHRCFVRDGSMIWSAIERHSPTHFYQHALNDVKTHVSPDVYTDWRVHARVLALERRHSSVPLIERAHVKEEGAGGWRKSTFHVSALVARSARVSRAMCNVNCLIEFFSQTRQNYRTRVSSSPPPRCTVFATISGWLWCLMSVH